MARVLGVLVVVAGLCVRAAIADPPAGDPPRAGFLVVRVTDPDGRPVARASVVIEPPHAGYAWANVVDGTASIAEPEELSPRDMLVKVDRPEDANGNALPLAPADVRVPRGLGSVTIVLPLERRVVGRLVGADGTGVGGVKVRAVRLSHHRPLGHRDFPLPEATTDANGRFDLGGLADEEHVLLFLPPREFSPVIPPRVRAGATDVLIKLRPAVAVDVRVLGSASDPIAGAYVRASALDRAVEGATVVATTDASGIARLASLDPALDYDLTAETGSEDKRHDGAQVKPWRPRDETMTLRAARRITGTVRDATGRPVQGVRVVVDEGPHACGPANWSDATKPDGTFEFDRAPRGDLTIRYWTREVAGSHRVAHLAAGASSIDLVLERGPTLAVHVRNRHDPDKDRSHVAVLWSESDVGAGYFQSTEISSDGTAVFGGLKEEETYRVVVTAVGGFSAARSGLRAGDDVIVALARGGTVRGRVVGMRRAEPIFVWLGAGSQWIASTQTGIDGSFVIEGVPEGRWPIYAGQFYGGKELVASGIVEDGGKIDLTLEPR